MAEPTPNTTDVVYLKKDSVIDISIPAAIYYRIQMLLFNGIAYSDTQTMHKTLNNIKESDEDPDDATFHTRTLLVLMNLIEEAASKQDKTEIKKVDKTTGKPV